MHYFILPHKLTFSFPAGTSRGVYTHRHVWYVFISESPIEEDTCRKIIADPRLLSKYAIGVGEIAPLHDLSCEYGREFQNTIDKCYREFVASKDIECLRHYPSIHFGIETATRSLHVHDGLSLFDTAFTRGEMGIPINGLVWMGDKDTMRQRMLSKMQAGFTCIKIKIGALHIEEELALLQELRQVASAKDLQIRVDANGAFTEAEALEVMEQLAKLDVHSIEQPIRSGDWDSMARLCKSAPLSIALDEELIGVNTPKLKEQLLQEIHPAYIVLKPTLHGGIQGCDEWIERATRHNIGYWITSALESNIGLNAIAQYTASLQTGDFAQGLGTGQLFVENIPYTGLTIEGNKIFRKL